MKKLARRLQKRMRAGIQLGMMTCHKQIRETGVNVRKRMHTQRRGPKRPRRRAWGRAHARAHLALQQWLLHVPLEAFACPHQRRAFTA